MQIAAAVPSPTLIPATFAPTTVATPPLQKFDRIFDLPGFAAGDKFKIAKGSTANGTSVGGEARLDSLTPRSAKMWIKAGKFGFNKQANISVEQISPTRARITVQQPKEPADVGDADIVGVRTGRSEFRGVPGGAIQGVVLLQVDPQGRLVVDMNSDAFGLGQAREAVTLHLILEKQRPLDELPPVLPA